MSDNKENVSVDEMMKSLKRGNHRKTRQEADPAKLEEGELVTRADGSKAIKVKSRKRRSTQPKKLEEKRAARNKVIAICSVIFLLLVMGIAFVFALAYYNGNKFKEKLTTTIQSKTGAEVEMRGLGMSLGSAKVMQLKLDWSASNSVVDNIELYGLNAGYGIFSFFGSGWNGPEVLADRGELKLNLLEAPGQIELGGESLVDFDFNTYKCNKLKISLPQNAGWSISDTQAEFSINTNGAKQVYLYGGKLKAPLFEEHSVKSGVVEIKPTLADVSLILQTKRGNGTVSLAGKIGYNKGESITMATKFAEVDMKDWVARKTQRFINGNISKGEGFIKTKLGDFDSKEILTHVESNSIAISTFAFIQTMSFEMKDSYYIRPSFKDGSTFTMNWKPDRVVFTNLNLVENSHMQVRGGFEILKNGDVNGKLKIGIPIVGLSPVEVRKLRKVFKEDDGDFIWAAITVGGTFGNPVDDLADQFEKAKTASPAEAFDQLNEQLSE